MTVAGLAGGPGLPDGGGVALGVGPVLLGEGAGLVGFGFGLAEEDRTDAGEVRRSRGLTGAVRLIRPGNCPVTGPAAGSGLLRLWRTTRAPATAINVMTAAMSAVLTTAPGPNRRGGGLSAA